LDTVPAPAAPLVGGGAPTAARASPGEVVRLSFPQAGVALVTLCDEENRNMFSVGLVRGVQRVFASIATREDVKVVVVQGFGNWFCSGGTPETLQAIRKGEMSFLDDSFFKSLLDCPLPTIAAIQGHALGGGLTLGLYADLIVMAEHAFYAANFMEHGFTPGVGATHLFPLRFGPVLGVDMMLSARRYQGRELKARGAPMEILPRDQVIERAMELATSLAAKPLLQLKRLKAHLADPIHQVLPAIMEKEQAMHDLVFAEHREDPGKEGSK
jgi:polyketide biosynthesis enoyl-CoA hydratase PksI